VIDSTVAALRAPERGDARVAHRQMAESGAGVAGVAAEDQELTERGFAMEESDEDTPQEKIEKARAESFPAGVPEDADVGTGRAKGTGLPPGSVGKGEETPQTPPT
jgi:hypothetical protein